MAHLNSTSGVIGVSGEVGKHSYSIEECESFVDFINGHPKLSGDESLKHILPLKPEALFEGVKDGVLLWYVFHIFTEFNHIRHQNSLTFLLIFVVFSTASSLTL